MLSVKACFCNYFYILNHSYKMAEAEAEVAVAEPEKSHGREWCPCPVDKNITFITSNITFPHPS